MNEHWDTWTHTHIHTWNGCSASWWPEKLCLEFVPSRLVWAYDNTVRDAHVAAGLVWTVHAFVVKNWNKECVINRTSKGSDVLLLYFAKWYGYYRITVCLVLVPCWLRTVHHRYTHSLLSLLLYCSFYLVEDILKAKTYFCCCMGHFFVTLRLLCNYQCSSMDYTNLYLFLYTCAIDTIQCGWHRGGPMGPGVHCELTDTRKNMYSSSFSFRIARVH